eukprot:TRINITY_DN719_c0_g1_i16.p2 TRINITY_DN719_c0_g1~~TRINITY_DN719_c0_g1_i16.p2  ORF type:complete len:206 (+),score=70.95 TRINITY_DN719_c0_g1_i16:389-1006(+)
MTEEIRNKLDINMEETNKQLTDFDTYCFIEKLPPIPSPPICVAFARHQPRHDPTVKSTIWVRERQELEVRMKKEDNEVLLVDPEGRVFEGLSSNFFAAKDGKLYTAPPGSVLEGTMQKMVITVAGEQQIPVVFEHPNISELSLWEGAFITSTSRAVLPIDELYEMQETESQVKLITMKQSPLIQKVKALVFKAMEDKSIPIAISI